MKYLLYIILTHLLTFPVIQQDKSKIITAEEMSEVYKQIGKLYTYTESYSFSTYHASYKSHNSTIPHEEEKGFYAKTNLMYYSKGFNAETIQNDQFKIVVLKEEKEIYIYDTDHQNLVDYPIEEYLRTLKSAEKITQTDHVDGSKSYIIYYKPGRPLLKFKIRVNQQGFITNISMYFSQNVEWEDEKGDIHSSKPRLEIAYKDINTKTLSKTQYSTSVFLTHSNGVFEGKGDYKTFAVNDMRLKK